MKIHLLLHYYAESQRSYSHARIEGGEKKHLHIDPAKQLEWV